MTWVVKLSLMVCMLLSVMGLTTPATATASELLRVTVTVNIENPDYFWQYPVLGKQLDCISISSFGKTIVIPTSSATEKIEVEVPTDYHLRMNINLQNSGSTVQSISYISREAIHKSNQNFTILLKAPEPQPAAISSPDFEIVRP